MLSKSQAKMFFLGGTAVCCAAFALLTIDTFRQLPDRTHEEKLTPEAIRGKHLFESNNCMGCHTILGEGAYYAPELTKVFERRGPVFISAMLKDPQLMYPNERKMVRYDFNDQQIHDLIEFFKWIGNVDTNGFPPKPSLGQIASPNATDAAGATVQRANRPAIFNQMCIACHTLEGQGASVGPVLDGVGSRRNAEYIGKWLHDPASVKPDAKMPKLPLSESDITELVAFLSQLKENVK